jgi:hypothetical protein
MQSRQFARAMCSVLRDRFQEFDACGHAFFSANARHIIMVMPG